MAEGHEQVETIDLDKHEMGAQVHPTHANANSEEYNTQLKDSDEIKLHNLEVELKNLETAHNTDCTYYILSTIILLWLLLSSFTLVSFIWAFNKHEQLFRISYLLFSWFMTFINLPFIIRPLLKRMSLWHNQMDQFSHKCFYFLHRFLHIGFITINILNTILIFNNTQFLGCFLIGIHNVILAFKIGSYLSLWSHNIKFHFAHFVLLCIALAICGILWGTQNGLLLLASIVVWLINFAIFVVVKSTLKRKQKKYFQHEQQIDAKRAHEKQNENELQRSKSSSNEMTYTPKLLSLRVNNDRKTEQELMSDYEKQFDGKMSSKKRLMSVESLGADFLDESAKHKVKRYKEERKVTCCCHKLICGLRGCLQIQTVVTAASIWGSVALFLLNKISWTCYGLMIFVSVTTIYNPICYTKRCYRIRTSPKCCSMDKFWLFVAYFFGIITVLITACLCTVLFIVANPFQVGNIDQTVGDDITTLSNISVLGFNDTETKLALMYSVWLIAFIAFLNYLPGAGWVFYQIPVGFAIINFLSFTMFLLTPLILVNTFINNKISAAPCIATEDFTCDIQNNSVTHLYNILYNGYKDRLQAGEELLYIPHLTALISFTIYLSLTGLGCSWYRFKKAIIESQANLTGNKKGLKYSKDYPMGIIMCFTLSLAFGDVVSDALYAFGTQDEQWASPSLKWLTISLFCLQILVQMISFNDVLSVLRQNLHQQSIPHCGWCHRHCTICYYIAVLPYYIIVFVIGILLGLSKLFAITQVQEWWFRLLIKDYKQEVERMKSLRAQTVESIQQLNMTNMAIGTGIDGTAGGDTELKLSVNIIPSDSIYNSNDGTVEIEMHVPVIEINGWKCIHCHMINDHITAICGGCYMEKDINENELKDWKCNKCQQLNDKTHVICGCCFQSKKDVTKVEPTVSSMNAPKPMFNEYNENNNEKTDSNIQILVNDIGHETKEQSEETDFDNNLLEVKQKMNDKKKESLLMPTLPSLHEPSESIDINAQIELAMDDIQRKETVHGNENENENEINALDIPQDEMSDDLVTPIPHETDGFHVHIKAETLTNINADVNEDLPTPNVESEQIADIISIVQGIANKSNENLQQDTHGMDNTSNDNSRSRAVTMDKLKYKSPDGYAIPSASSSPVLQPMDHPNDMNDISFEDLSSRSRAGTKMRVKFSIDRDDEIKTNENISDVDELVIVTDIGAEKDIDVVEVVREAKKKEQRKKRQERLDHVLEGGTWMGYNVGKGLIWTIYLWIESFTPLWMSKLRVRANIYNSYFVSELIIESWPQLVTNLVNAYYKGFSVISNISAAFSVMMISYIMLKIIYYVGIQGKGLDKIVL